MAARQAPPSLGFPRQEHWSGLPFPSPMHESEKWKWSRSVVSDSSRPHGLQPSRLLRPWGFPGKSTGVGHHCLFQWWLGILIITNDKSGQHSKRIIFWYVNFVTYLSLCVVLVSCLTRTFGTWWMLASGVSEWMNESINQSIIENLGESNSRGPVVFCQELFLVDLDLYTSGLITPERLGSQASKRECSEEKPPSAGVSRDERPHILRPRVGSWSSQN